MSILKCSLVSTRSKVVIRSRFNGNELGLKTKLSLLSEGSTFNFIHIRTLVSGRNWFCRKPLRSSVSSSQYALYSCCNKSRPIPPFLPSELSFDQEEVKLFSASRTRISKSLSTYSSSQDTIDS